MFKQLTFVAILLALSGCGSVYISPDVAAENNASVQVVSLTAQSVKAANASTYRPKSVPDAFFQNAGAGGVPRGAGVTPEPAFERERRPAALATRIPPQVQQTPYQIGVGDVLLLAMRATGGTVAELSGLLAAQNSRQGYTVQDDGAIAIPDVGRIPVSGLTLEEAEAGVFQALVESQIDPSFSLEVAEFNSKRVSIGGSVARPTIASMTMTGLTLSEGLAAAGGFLATDQDFASIRIYRDGNLYQIPVNEYLKTPDYQKIRLVAGDSIFVDTEFELAKAQSYFQEQITLSEFRNRARAQAIDELKTEIDLRRASLEESRTNFKERLDMDAVDRDFVYLTGEVSQPGRFALPYGRQATLADALFDSGGFNAETGDPSQIYVLRGDTSGQVTAWHLDARNVVDLVVATRMQMRPNDIVFIAEQRITRWNRVVQQIVPSLISTGLSAAAN